MSSDLEDPKLDRNQVKAAASVMATVAEVASYLGTTEDVIDEFYIEDVRQGWLQGKLRIRQMVFDIADGKGEKLDQRMVEALARAHLGMDGGKR